MTASAESRRLASIAARAADEKKATDIAVYDVADIMAISEIFVVVTGASERMVRAIVEEVEDELTAAGAEPLRREGNRENRWVLLDYGHFVVHVQRAPEREFYGLDRLYRDCELIEVEGVPAFERPGDYGDEVNIREVSDIDEIPLASEGPVEEDEDDGDLYSLR
ncbi:ribosome silencing factor [Corynebacterium guangdongense]|uniref:Ribosomal silencing factor RsfS n=1 Tax=Corynebacterium guangdongense TaxID=1783348 RepID=A0ABU1ZYL4_9CORY|nr:ribosome silencing factor [Corynebacterium guangdongense]MDR7330029.1 ribosome-associated protein [Corynebacterium guangdongense]WJZ18587.1 Ribosomal silencing factor RsfS [Corynebacterium guangdongense]